MYLCDFYLAVIRQYYTMHNFMKKSALILFTLVGLNIGIVAKAEQPLREKALAAKTYCVEKGFNTNYCFLVDFSIHSGKRRFFVWDFKGDSVKYASLCAHGYGKNSTLSKPVFSNVEGSYCSSLGKYKVGRIASGGLMFIINCMDWKQRITMLSNGISCYILILRCRKRRCILCIFH